MYVIAELKLDNGQSVSVITLPPKDFKTGSKGFYGNARVEIEGKRYQVQVQMVEIGSKPRPDGES